LILKKIAIKIQQSFNTSLIGYVTGHNYLTKSQINDVKLKVGVQTNDYSDAFENKFAGVIGSGEAVSFASGRMGFFVLMDILGVGYGDEVILCGFTCSVMPNAVLRVGATPIYSDIDPITYGSSKQSIEACISPKTKMVVAQHSFGIPCEIESISKLCKLKNIPLIEDCALALGSKLKGKQVGTYGTAAIFSTDHSKPINTIIGGLVYSESTDLIKKVKVVQTRCDFLPLKVQRAVWRQFKAEIFLARPKVYGILQLYNSISAKVIKKLRLVYPYLNEDTGNLVENKNYSYPAKLPEFLALIGIYELEQWEYASAKRLELLEYYKTNLNNTALQNYLPEVYFDNDRFIIPLRFIFSCPMGMQLRSKLKNVVTVEDTWFLEPIINYTGCLGDFLYEEGMCINSEKVGPTMVNLPLVSFKVAKKIIDEIL